MKPSIISIILVAACLIVIIYLTRKDGPAKTKTETISYQDRYVQHADTIKLYRVSPTHTVLVCDKYKIRISYIDSFGTPHVELDYMNTDTVGQRPEPTLVFDTVFERQMMTK